MTKLYPDHPLESVQVFQILIFCLIPISFIYIYGTLLTANGNLKLLNITAIAGIFVNLTINIILIPKLHACGAAIAAVSTQSIVCILQIAIAFKLLKISFKKLPYINYLIFTILLIVFTYFISQKWSWGNLLLTCFLSVVFAFISGLIPLKQMKKIFLSKE